MRLGLFGVGASAQNLMRALAASDSFKLWSAHDSDPDVRSRLPEGVTFYGDGEAFLADPMLDVVFIATPSCLHVRHALAAVGAGKRVLVEKPAAISGAEYAELRAACLTRNAPIVFALHAAFGAEIQPASAKLEEMQSAGVHPVRLHSEFFDPYIGPDGPLTHALSLVSSWLDSGPNALSVLATLFPEAEIEPVSFAQAYSGDTAVAARAGLYIRTGSGKRIDGLIETDWRLERNYKVSSIECSDGSRIFVDHTRRRVTHHPAGNSPASVIYEDHSDLDRLAQHYVALLAQTKKVFDRGGNNWSFSDAVHGTLFGCLALEAH